MSMPLKTFLIRKLSLKLNISEKLITTVINHQFTEAFNATSTHNSIEISGFGKFLFNQPKAHKQMIKYEEQLAAYNKLLETSTSEDIIRNVTMRLATTLKNIEHLKPKLK